MFVYPSCLSKPVIYLHALLFFSAPEFFAVQPSHSTELDDPHTVTQQALLLAHTVWRHLTRMEWDWVNFGDTARAGQKQHGYARRANMAESASGVRCVRLVRWTQGNW